MICIIMSTFNQVFNQLLFSTLNNGDSLDLDTAGMNLFYTFCLTFIDVNIFRYWD